MICVYKSATDQIGSYSNVSHKGKLHNLLSPTTTKANKLFVGESDLYPGRFHGDGTYRFDALMRLGEGNQSERS